MGDEPKTLADGSATADVVAVLGREMSDAKARLEASMNEGPELTGIERVKAENEVLRAWMPTAASGEASAYAQQFAGLSQDLAAAEQEAAQATEAPAPSCALGPGGSIPLADLRERLKMLSDAWVEIYEDGPLRLRFDIEGRRMHVAGAQGQQGKVDW